MDALDSLFEDFWEYRLREAPELASRTGDLRYNHLWQAKKPRDYARRVNDVKVLLRRLDALEMTSASRQQQLSCDLMKRELRLTVEAVEANVHLLPTLVPVGFQMLLPFMPSALPFTTVKDYEDFIGRFLAFPAFVDDNLDLIAAGLDVGFAVPAVQYPKILATLKPYLNVDPRDSEFYRPFANIPERFGSQQVIRLQGEAEAAIATHVLPQYHRIQKFVEERIKPRLRDSIGLSDLPGGRICYAYFVREQADSDLSPEEIHAIGLAEVARLEAEMTSIAEAAGVPGLNGYASRLRSDPAMFAESGEAYVERARSVCKQIDPALTKLFTKLPRTPYGVSLIPADLATTMGTPGNAEAPSGDGRKPGMLRINPHRIGDLPYYMMQATMLHECAPGHLMHFALTNEIDDLPKFRRYGMNGGYTAYVEGWALYCESLGVELGLPQLPEERFGQLDFERLRAARLVVDTGIHALGWSRDQAIDYLDNHCTLGRPLATSEVDRYIGMPAQALSYKLGQLKIRELRTRAEAALGAGFDLRAFHNEILSLGGVSLDVMEKAINAWIHQSIPPAATASNAAPSVATQVA